MIYLFNSANRPLYARNVLNTLFLPYGGTNKYRYRFSGDNVHISQDSYSIFTNESEGSPVVIVFIDRFGSDGYVYHPIRQGKLIDCFPKDTRLYFKVQLQDYIYPKDLKQFNEVIVSTLNGLGLPKIPNEKQHGENDGFYAIKANSLFDIENQFEYGENAWNSAYKNIIKTDIFTSSSSNNFLFLRCEFYKKSRGQKQPFTPILRDKSAALELVRGKKYEMVVNYHFPIQETDKAATAITTVVFGDELKPVNPNKINIESCSDSISLSLVTKRYLEEHETSISFSYTNKNFELIGPDSKINIRIKEGFCFWSNLLISLSLFNT